ncbi:M48 family metallopeptidase [Algiphilus sp.]|uniref:M48 family metallopeptidase n=1 Tax=Algiphilus sp. TaxID=1872431 RepID=UPI003C53A683
MKPRARSPYTLAVGELAVTVERKRVKYLRLRVSSADGALRLSAPPRVSDAELRAFVASRQDWVRRHRERLAARPTTPRRDFEAGQAVPLWGETLILGDRAAGRARTCRREGDTLLLPADATATRESRQRLVHQWYRRMLEARIAERLPRAERAVHARAARIEVRRMRSRWGSCTVQTRRIRIGLALVAQPRICLDYVLIHELAHLRESGHTPRFWAIVERAMPGWRDAHAVLRGAAPDPGLWH